MKRITCKVLIWIGCILVLLPVLVFVFALVTKNENTLELSLKFINSWNLAVVLLLVAWWGWNSEERKARKKEIRDLQIEALRQSVRKGKTEVSMVGKMRKLK